MYHFRNKILYPSSTEVKNECNCISSPPVGPHGVDRNNSAFNVHVPLILPATANTMDNFTPALIRLGVEWLII